MTLHERALKERPDDPDALAAYGWALLEAGRAGEAEGPIRKAIERKPDDPGYKLNLAELRLRTGDFQGGVAELKQINAAHPDYAPAFARLGRAYVERRELGSAAEALDRALQLAPSDHATAVLLARTLAAQKNYGAACQVLDHADKLRPDDLEALELRLKIAKHRHDRDSSDWRALAAAHIRVGRYGEALAALERLLEIEPRSAELLTQYASTALSALEYDKAEKALHEAEGLSPNNAHMLATKALLLIYQGKKAEAEAYCLRCIAADPNYVAVYPQLSALRRGKLSESEEQVLDRWSRRADVATASRASAAFVLAQSLEARGEAERAFAEYERANALAAERNRAEQVRYDFEGHAAWTEAIIGVFRKEPAQGFDDPGPHPIFIVGLPRCGSTLVESVIAAHSKVEPGGEMPMMPNLFNDWLKANWRAGEVSLTADARAALAAAYRRGAPAAFTKERFTDKNLLKFEAAGLIAEIFPKALIINVRRNPVENAFAIWRQDLLKFWSYATSFEDIARRYGLYARLTDHFERAYPTRFRTIQYEDFVRNFNEEARRLIALLDLPWEERCADFQQARAVASTMSAIQVRDEVRLKEDRATMFGARLDPLRKALEAAGVDLKKGTLRKGAS